MTAAPRRPEVLAPVGSPECLPAAVAGGANAVYLGLRHFNARGRAENFRKADLAHHVAYLHRHGVKCYLVMNTLVHDDEYPKALDLAACAADAGVDAAIIQDLGLWTVLAKAVPGLKRHASTQMTIHHPSQVAVLAGLGAERVILARELSLGEVEACTTEANRLGIETEHFVHGALCYAFSGQCLMSNFAGCRSANRGTCAQNCRFEYESAGAATDTVLSMKDFALIGRVHDLARIGVASLKIEGRLKGPDYVYTTSRVYRAAVDAWAEGKRFDVAAAQELLRDVFARPHTDAPLRGAYGEESRLHRWAPDKDRQPDAHLISLDRKNSRAELRAREVRAGQGFAYTHGMWNGGFLVIAADKAGPDRWKCKVRLGESGPPLPSELPLYRNADHQRKREAATAMGQVAVPPAPPEAVALRLAVTGGLGAPLHVRATTVDGRSAEAVSEQALIAAANAPIDHALLLDKLGALGGTGFRCTGLDLDLAPGLFIPAAGLKRLRRDLVEALAAQPAGAVVEPAPRWTPPEPGIPRVRRAALWVAVRDVATARAALEAGAEAVWLDDATLDLWGAQAPTIDLGGLPRDRVWLRHPASVRPSPHLAAIGLPVVAGNLGALAAARAAGLSAIADAACNTFGYATLSALGALGATAAVISLECSSREVARLAARCGTAEAAGETLPAIALTVHGRLPAMLTRQDHGLTPGQEMDIRAVEKEGGLPYRIQRRAGGETVIWEGRRLCCPETVADTATLVDAWVLELGDLDAPAVAELVAAYVALRDGGGDTFALREVADRHAPEGLFTGHLVNGSRELDLVLERQEADVGG